MLCQQLEERKLELLLFKHGSGEFAWELMDFSPPTGRNIGALDCNCYSVDVLSYHNKNVNDISLYQIKVVAIPVATV